MKNLFRYAFCVLQSLLFIVSSFSVYDSKFKIWVDRSAMNLTSETKIAFDAITADEMRVSDSEKKQCRAWYEAHLLGTDAPAYNFTVGGREFQKHVDDWAISVGKESAPGAVRRGGKTTVITLTHKKSGLVAAVEATIYEEFATCDWTVSIKNEGEADSPVIKSFNGADFTLDSGMTDLYFSRGSDAKNDDFELMKSPVSPLKTVFNASGGRNSAYLPYYNLQGKNLSAVMAVGWTGQWYTSFRQTVKGVDVIAKQEFFKAYLTPGEQVRSPLVSLTFYDGKNALKGFNTFRNWESNCVYTESAYPVTCTILAGEFDKRNSDQLIEFIQGMSQEMCDDVDFLWMDAGWYEYTESWYDGVGNWLPNKARFPDGLAPIAEAAESRGMGLLLWYEPERCCQNTRVYNECVKHPGWLVSKNEEVNMVNLAFDGCCDYLGELVANSLKDNKISLYRQDFNFTPLDMWKQCDKDYFNGRSGIEENHYVTNLYRYLDTLLEVNPGLIIDNCASGGRRIDLEMSRRSIPLWRTDYNCSTELGEIKDDAFTASQVATYGLSFWLPLSGTGLNAYTEYADRSVLTACSQRSGYREVREMMDENYYPLTYGALDLTKYHAFQFGSETRGNAMVYRRENVKSEQYKLMLNGLDPAKTYILTNYDDPNETYTKTGAELMDGGVTVTVTDCPKCAIYFYEALR